MGGVHQLHFVERNKQFAKEPILEVGSKDYGTTAPFRAMFPNAQYLAIDMEDGKGVDIVLDLTEDIETIKAKLPIKKFKTIINFSVLEHCANPFKMAQNLEALLEKDGIMYLGVPFVWKIHGYPGDYWRFTPDGIRTLFPNIDWDYPNETTDSYGKPKPIDTKFGTITIRGIKASIKAGRYSLFTGIILYICRVLHIMPIIFQHSILFPETLINMIGRKR